MRFVAMWNAGTGCWMAVDWLMREMVGAATDRKFVEQIVDDENAEGNENPIRDRAEQKRLLGRRV